MYIFDEDYQYKIIDGQIWIPIGIDLKTYSAVYWNPLDPSQAHLLIGGSTGAGKSVVLRVIITHILKYDNVKIYMQDTKIVDLYKFEKAKQIVALNEEKDFAVETLKSLVEEMKRRYKFIKSRGGHDISDLKKKQRPDFIFYILEELASFGSPKGQDKEFYELLAELLARGRASGIFVIITTQAPYSEILPGMLKNNINSTLGLKTKTAEASKVVCGDFEALVNLRGKGHGKFFTAGDMQELQGFKIKDDTIKKIIKENRKENLNDI